MSVSFPSSKTFILSAPKQPVKERPVEAARRRLSGYERFVRHTAEILVLPLVIVTVAWKGLQGIFMLTVGFLFLLGLSLYLRRDKPQVLRAPARGKMRVGLGGIHLGQMLLPWKEIREISIASCESQVNAKIQYVQTSVHIQTSKGPLDVYLYPWIVSAEGRAQHKQEQEDLRNLLAEYMD